MVYDITAMVKIVKNTVVVHFISGNVRCYLAVQC